MAANLANTDRSEHKETKTDAVKAPAVRDAGRDRAIDLAVSTIEKQFGKGSIMRLGDDIAPPEVQSFPRALSGSTSRSAWAGCRAAASSKSTVRSLRARPRWRCTWWRRRSVRAGSVPSSTPSTRSTSATRASWG
jgi:hypothetical protein